MAVYVAMPLRGPNRSRNTIKLAMVLRLRRRRIIRTPFQRFVLVVDLGQRGVHACMLASWLGSYIVSASILFCAFYSVNRIRRKNRTRPYTPASQLIHSQIELAKSIGELPSWAGIDLGRGRKP